MYQTPVLIIRIFPSEDVVPNPSKTAEKIQSGLTRIASFKIRRSFRHYGAEVALNLESETTN